MNNLAVVPKRELVLSAASPLVSARAFIQYEATTAAAQTLYYKAGDFFSWSGRHYPVEDDEYLRARLYHFLDTAQRQDKEGNLHPFSPTSKKVSDVIDALKAECSLARDTHSPAWLGETADLEAKEIISCANGLLHLPTRTLLPHTPDFFIHNAVEFPYNASAPQPVEWLKFLDQIFPADTEAVRALQQMFGYLLTGDTRQQKAFLLIGPKRSGKGTVARILTRILGQENVTAPTLASLGTQFGMEALLDKRLALVGDARLGHRADIHAITERILSITGEDYVSVERKFKRAKTVRLETRFMILSNELPKLSDASGALASRFIMITLTQSFIGREDKGLEDRLIQELPGIFNWAIEGYNTLAEEGRFIMPSSSVEAMQELEDLASPMSQFIREKCKIAPSSSAAASTLYEEWVRWCGEVGRDHAGTLQSFARDLRSVVPHIRVVSANTGGVRSRRYEGIGLADVW